jgi:hypothetical protein
VHGCQTASRLRFSSTSFGVLVCILRKEIEDCDLKSKLALRKYECGMTYEYGGKALKGGVCPCTSRLDVSRLHLQHAGIEFAF